MAAGNKKADDVHRRALVVQSTVTTSHCVLTPMIDVSLTPSWQMTLQ